MSQQELFEVIFEGKGNVDTTIWKPMGASKLSTSDSASTATDKSYMYKVDTTGLNQLRVRVTSITGNLSVYGTCVG